MMENGEELEKLRAEGNTPAPKMKIQHLLSRQLVGMVKLGYV